MCCPGQGFLVFHSDASKTHGGVVVTVHAVLPPRIPQLGATFADAAAAADDDDDGSSGGAAAA